MVPLQPWIFQKDAREMDLSYVHFRRIFKQLTSFRFLMPRLEKWVKNPMRD